MGDSEAGRETVLVRSKLAIPELPAAFVSRPRLVAPLRRLVLEHRVVVVSATAGAGKTTAVAEAVRGLHADVAWLTVDRTDTAPGRLFVYLSAALATHRPQADELARRALAAGLTHREAAASMVEELGAGELVLVIDELEQLADAPEAWAVLDAVVRYAPPQLRLVLLSRRNPPEHLVTFPPETTVEGPSESQLAFTVEEAAKALASLGKSDIAADSAVHATGGWVTGVLFEAWHAREHVDGTGGEVDPLHGYLSTHILRPLDPRDLEFLVTTSVLDEVSPRRAQALGWIDAGARLGSLRRAHLPATWTGPDGRTLRCHSRFREFLRARMTELDADVLLDLRRRTARLLAEEGHHEEATEVLLGVGLVVDAREYAERAVLTVIERLDLDIADRWLSALGDEPSASDLTTARLMRAVARDDFHHGVAIADRLALAGTREELAAHSPRAAALMGWSYLICGRATDADVVLAAATGPEVAAVRYALHLWVEDTGPDATETAPLSGGAMDAVVLITRYYSGLLQEVVAPDTSPWIQEVAGLHRAAALRATGHTHEALELYEASRPDATGRIGITQALLGSEIMLEAGNPEAALRLLHEGYERARGSGAVVYEIAFRIVEIKAAIRLDDPRTAWQVLERLRGNPLVDSSVYYREVVSTLDALLMLLGAGGDDTRALGILRDTVASMGRGARILELPAAAVFLAEAEWRAGNEEESDRAAELALAAAARQGANHVLLQALARFPAVLSRRIDAEPEADSPWHALGRALITQDHRILEAVGRPTVHVNEFGRKAMTVLGQELRPAIGKSLELLAFLVVQGGAADRNRLLDVLFEGRRDDAAGAYLRQAVRRLREVLPDPDDIVLSDGVLRLRDRTRITSDSTRFEARLGEAARLRGEDRLQATRAALGLYDRGPYLEALDSPWIEARRDHLSELAVTARIEAAALSLELGLHQQAQELVERALGDDPYREGGWRLAMSVANARGDYDGVVSRYLRCKSALAALGLSPAPATRRLLGQLRR
ncbi:BTAD domain-containing putative transcriptional regulator [Streptomyces sp. NPDC048281]|uniref:BTAD domain-containing putative transcriptional regulator n=1 Tax=Streptomyces sp. NPDC048281 TaxID=3154715 RepID=UPI003426A5D1